MAKRIIPKCFDDDQIIKFFDSIKKTNLAVACWLALMLGLRIGDIINLKWKDINLESLKIFIRRGKTGEDNLDFPSTMLPILKKWKYLTEKKSEYILPYTSENNETRLARLTHSFGQARRASGLNNITYITKYGKEKKKFTFHSLRHTAGRLTLEKTGDIYFTKELLRHSSIKSTEIYSSVSNTKKRETLERIHNFNKPKQQNQNIQSVIINPLDALKMKFINEEITEQEYLNKIRILNLTKVMLVN